MTKRTITPQQLAKARRLVRLILDHHFGSRPSRKGEGRSRIEHMSSGLTNLVFSVHDANGDFIVRLGSDATKIGSFMKEQWAIAKARERGVPAPEVLHVGNEAVKLPYMISRQSEGTEATVHHGRERIVRELGRWASQIHCIRTGGFGATFEWSQNQLSHNATWSEFLQNELKIDDALAVLGRQGMLDIAKVKRLRSILEKAAGKGRTPALNHGDLRLKNVLADDEGKITCILDWEHCTSNLAPEWDIALALHDLSIDAKQAFLEGYGISPKQLAALSPVLKALTIINYAREVLRAAKSKNKTELEWFRARLHGELDLYSL